MYGGEVTVLLTFQLTLMVFFSLRKRVVFFIEKVLVNEF